VPKTRSPFLQTRTDGGVGPLFFSDARFAPNNVFFVNSASSNAGDSGGKGQTPDAPFATINYAVGQCEADKGDLVVALPGHVETVTAAAGVALNVAGVSVVGVGRGRQRPKVSFTTAAAASFDVTAARCSVENVTFVNGVASQTAMLNVQAADFTLRDCEFDHASASSQAVLVILGNSSADRLRVEGCPFHGANNAGTSAAISLVGGNDVKIIKNLFTGAYHASNGVIKNATTDCLNLYLIDNLIQNLTAANTKSIVLTSGSTGHVSGNMMQVLAGSAPVTGAAMSWAGNNLYAAAIATAGSGL
jgi:hypothetical protein